MDILHIVIPPLVPIFSYDIAYIPALDHIWRAVKLSMLPAIFSFHLRYLDEKIYNIFLEHTTIPFQFQEYTKFFFLQFFSVLSL